MLTKTSRHIPILLEPISDFLVEGLRNLPESAPKGVILDCTLGGGGHSASILAKMKAHPTLLKHCVMGLDRDPEAVARNRAKFSEEISKGQVEVVYSAFSDALKAVGDRPIYGLLADLGVSSDQIDSETRGFSFRFEGVLDMRMNPAAGESVAELLSEIHETALADMIWKYGEDRFSRKIARKIVDLRSRGALPKTSAELAEAIATVFPPAQRYKGIHPATRTFQALRIYVNDELGELEKLIREVFPRVAQGGHLAVLAFHSLEDRLVKEAFRTHELYDLPSRKAIQASDQEVEQNPRSRSAKLRFAIRK